MPDDCYDVWSYDVDRLKKFFSIFSETPPHFIERKLHSRYFSEYFSKDGVDAKTVVVEKDYVDRDFLLDYAGYYARCFRDYPRHCARLHFFSLEFSKEDLEAVLSGSNPNLEAQLKEKESYLGFIVVKPVRQTVVGRTCLKTYPESDTDREFPNTRDYEVHLFGLPLSVRTLAFQEQDQVVSACATSALWSAFQGTGKLFHHAIPPPIEITKAAYLVESEFEPRAMPNQGLSLVQIFHAIRAVTLEPFRVKALNEHVLKSTVYGYLKSGIPLLLVFYIYDNRTQPPAYMGYHAVTVTGFNLGLPNPSPYGDTGFLLTASKVNKLYVHDDQIGPFARMVFDGQQVCIAQDGVCAGATSLSSSWPGADGTPDAGRAVPDILVAPLYQTIRIPFETIHDLILEFDSVLQELRKQGFTAIPQKLEWNIYLINSNVLKNEILGSHTIGAAEKKTVLLECMPRFLWRAQAISMENNQVALDVLFDSTEIKQGKLCYKVISYDQNLWQLLLDLAASDEFLDMAQQQTPLMLTILGQVKDQSLTSNS